MTFRGWRGADFLDVVRGRLRRIQGGAGAGLWFDRVDASHGYWTGANEAPVQEAIQLHARPGSVVYDVGANIGFLTVIAARLVGVRGKVYAFEPVPSNAAVIRRNCRLNGLSNVAVIERAVADRTGTMTLLLARHLGGAVLEGHDPPPDLSGRMTVDVTTIDDLVRAGLAVPPDVVKIDVEGAEPQVLAGMRVTVAQHGPVIVCELDAADEATLDSKVAEWEKTMQGISYETRTLPDAYPAMGWHVRHLVCTPR